MSIAASILAGAATLFAGLMTAGSVYQRIGARRDRRRYTGEGRWIGVGDRRRLYLVEKGVGSPTIVFESGIAATTLNWSHIQQAVSRFTRTVSYDRGGLGWSSPAASARTPSNIAIELHTMLRNASIRPPYLLVGHSFGGLAMRRYALLYPEDVLGMVLVDPMRGEEWPPLDPAKQAALNRGRWLAGIGIPLAYCGLARLGATWLLCRTGRISDLMAGRGGHRGMHVLSRIKGEVDKMPPAAWPMVAAHWSRPSYYAGMIAHVQSVPDTVLEMAGAAPIRSIPITLLTPGTSSALDAEGLSRVGDRVRQILAPECSHWVHLDNPALVVEAIREMLAAVAPEATQVPV